MKKFSLTRIKNYIRWKIFCLFYAKKMAKVLAFIKCARGKGPYSKINKENGTCIVCSGIKNINTYIFSAGDCARFAKLLVMAFQQYKPRILLVKYNKAPYKTLWDHAIVDFGQFYADISGIWFPKVAKIRYDIDHAYHIKRLDVPVLDGNMYLVKLMNGISTQVPSYDFMMVHKGGGNIEIHGFNNDFITALSKVYKNQSSPSFLDDLEKIRISFKEFEYKKIPGVIWE